MNDIDSSIGGVLAPVVTPFKEDYTPDAPRLAAHCNWLTAQDCGLAVFGTNSEANSLSVDERIDLLATLVDAGVDCRRLRSEEHTSELQSPMRISYAVF